MNHRKDRRGATSRLFHTVVVIGASMGCGLEVAPATDAGPAGAGPTVLDAGVSVGPGLVAPGFAVDAGAGVDAGADANEGGPQSICDCPEPGQFVCDACSSGVGPVEGHCPFDDGVNCRCDSSRPLAGPDQCADPAFYTCADAPDGGTIHGDYDWFQFANCWCDPTRPTTPAACDNPDAGYPTELWCMQSGCFNAVGQLKYACECIPVPTIR